MSKRAFPTLLLSLCATAMLGADALGAPASREKIVGLDRILVVVENDVITENEFLSQLNTVKRQSRLSKRALPPDEALRKRVMDRMVMDRIQLQYATRSGLKVSEEMIDEAVAKIAKRNGLTVPQLRQALARDNIRYEYFRNNLRNQVTIQRLVDRDIKTRVSVTDSEIDNYLLTIEQQGGIETEYDLSHIFIALPRGASRALLTRARQHADALHGHLVKGVNFERAAAEFSRGPEALNGGRLGWKKPGQLPKYFLPALQDMRAGEISPVIQAPNGYHILRLNDRRGVGPQTVTQTHARHILIRPDEVVTLEEATERITQLRARIAAGENFASLAKGHSQDPASSLKGGDLGWVSPGTMVPEFERAMSELGVGELSAPVRTRFGVHLIEVIGLRQHDVGKALQRDYARRQILERKAKERYEVWLQRLRDEAYVEHRADELD